MKAEVLDQLVVALRSGQYRKCIGRMRRFAGDHDEYCADGVLCDLAPVGQWINDARFGWLYGQGANERGHYLDTEGNFLPLIVREWAGVSIVVRFPLHYDRLDPKLQIRLFNLDIPDRNVISLELLNDRRDDHLRNGLSFQEIADILEAHRDFLISGTEWLDD